MFKAIANFGAEPDTSEMPKNLFLKKNVGTLLKMLSEFARIVFEL